MAIVAGQIRCPECLEWKALEHYEHCDQQRGSGYCRLCKRERKRRWYESNADRDTARRRGIYAARKSPEGLLELQRRDRIRRDESLKGRKASLARHRLRSRYGLSETDYAHIVAEQSARCAVCGVTRNIDDRLWCVDHDHDTGHVRGLLCTRCNAGIGALGDNIEGLRRALAYLERAEKMRPPARPMRINLLAGVKN